MFNELRISCCNNNKIARKKCEVFSISSAHEMCVSRASVVLTVTEQYMLFAYVPGRPQVIHRSQVTGHRSQVHSVISLQSNYQLFVGALP